MLDKELIQLLADIEDKQVAPIPCAYCGWPFRPKRAWAKFCSPICKYNQNAKDAALRKQVLKEARADLKRAGRKLPNQAFLEEGMRQQEETLQQLKESNSELRKLLFQDWETRIEETLQALRAMGIVDFEFTKKGTTP